MSPYNEFFLKELDQQIQSKHLLTHPFYQAWTKGELSIDCLKEYANQYYHHVKAFPTYISAIHARTEDSNTRKILLQNLIEEEAGTPNHPELWRTFVKSLGVTEEEIENHVPNRDMTHLIGTFRDICGNEGVAEGVAALYSYESQIPAICISKIDGLKKHYQMKNPESWEYFRVHIAADEVHAAEERELLDNHLNVNNSSKVKKSSNRVLNALWDFLSGLCDKYEIACA
jgi:pyrroloquinoline-quinone synthase